MGEGSVGAKVGNLTREKMWWPTQLRIRMWWAAGLRWMVMSGRLSGVWRPLGLAAAADAL